MHISEAKYREVIRCKTALLFEAATHTGAILSQLNQPNSVSDEQVQAMQQFGQHFGVTYQLVDDWLDYAGDAATMGKNVGDDFAEGKLTLPLIFALQHGTVEDKKIITDAINNRSAEQLPQIQKIVSESGALDYTHNAAVAESKHALQCLAQLPNGPYTDALTILTEYCTARLF